jgi:linoleoyl-CoA desaturase
MTTSTNDTSRAAGRRPQETWGADGEAVPLATPGLPKFAAGGGFYQELRNRVDRYFRVSGRRPRDCPALYRKMVIILLWLAASYGLLVFGAWAWWLAVPLAASLGLAMAAVGFNMQHDAGHRACSDRPWVNRLMALSLDLIGASSYVWHWKHNIIHHTYVNITDHDDDVAVGFLARLTPHQKRYPFHRFQHWYLWVLYGVMAIKWHFWNDFRAVAVGRIASHRFPRPRGWNLAALLGGKALFAALAFGVPMLVHPWWVVLLFYGLTVCVLGMTLGVVFQLAHCVEEAAFPMPRPETGRIDNSWAVHQVETTLNFARQSRVVTWLAGGLNFQIEHHLFPHICHVNYPAISKIVEDTCREFGVRYATHKSFWAGLASHYRWLRRLGMPPEQGQAPAG